MLTQEIKSKVQRLWNMFWSRGITNPITGNHLLLHIAR